MNIVYNSESYAIVAYPLSQGLELVDKLRQPQPVRAGVGGDQPA